MTDNPPTPALTDDELADALEATPGTPPVYVSDGKSAARIDPDGTTTDLSGGMVAGALSDDERSAMTFLGETIGAQIRVYSDLTGEGTEAAPFGAGARRVHLAIHHRKDAPRTREVGRPWEVSPVDVLKLRDLLETAAHRGLL